LRTLDPVARQRRRTALSQGGGKTRARGDPKLATLLRRALEAPEDVEGDALTHGFHAYPARMHHMVARTLLTALPIGRGPVLDPFCGSGTVLIEGMLNGASCVGVDLNPIALKLARVKSDVRDASSRSVFLDELERIARASLQRVRERVDSRAPIPRSEARWYDGHVLKELAGLREEILAVERENDRLAFLMVLSAVLIKFSRQRADTSERRVHKDVGKGLCTDFFLRKAQELVRRWAELEEAAPPDCSSPELIEGDARRLQELLGDRRCDLVLTSPPYGGTYDYVDHHARRFPWLGLDASLLREHEIGARRNLRGGRAGARRWDDEMRAVLAAIACVLGPDGHCVLLVGDAQIGRTRVAADEQIERLGAEVGLGLAAVASQRRRDHSGHAPRHEHLVALTRR